MCIIVLYIIKLTLLKTKNKKMNHTHKMLYMIQTSIFLIILHD
jgi:hypothetical protein